MARKHGPDHKRYQPVDEALMRSVPYALPAPIDIRHDYPKHG